MSELNNGVNDIGAKKAVVLLAHGSRASATENTMKSIAAMVQEKLTDAIVEECYMEFRDKTISGTLDSLVARGASKIMVVPYFLFEGIHILHDIPDEIAAFESKNPNVTVVLGRPLGVDSRLADILIDRIGEVC